MKENTMILREADPERDFKAVAGLLSNIKPEPVTAEQLHQEVADSPEGRRMVLLDAGQVIGYGLAVLEAGEEDGRFHLWVGIDPARRRQGLGTLLFANLLQFARQQGAAVLTAEVREDDVESLRFARKNGFSRHEVNAQKSGLHALRRTL